MWIKGSQFSLPALRRPWATLLLCVAASLAALLGLLFLLDHSSFAAPSAPAAPIPPPEGFPKLHLSTKSVTPTLTTIGDAILTYTIEIRNTGAFTAARTTLVDTLPDEVTYRGDGWASHGPQPTFDGSNLTWRGRVGFDTTVIVMFSVRVDSDYARTVRNTAVINAPGISRPVTVTADSVVTDEPILTIEKTSSTTKPGANKPLVYELRVTNWGQPAVGEPITVTDRVPTDTELLLVGEDGSTNEARDVVTFTRPVDLGLGESTTFTFSVNVGDVFSGTVIANDEYEVAATFGVTVGNPYTLTVVDPILFLAKQVWPDPPGSNREMTYTLALLNVGSQATGLTITDRVPTGVSYVRGGTEQSGVVSWSLPSLETAESAQFTYTVYVSDVMNVPIVNSDYGACSAEGACAAGVPLTSVVQGPVFDVFASVFPIAKKPGGEEITPTLRVHNVGQGNAIAATAVLTFYRMSLTDDDVVAFLPDGSTETLKRGPSCGNKCRTFPWTGDIGHDEWVTFTVPPGISTIGGAEGDRYTATVIITDALSNMTTPTATAQAGGKITHFASVVPYKSAPPVTGRGYLLTYTIRVANHGFTTQLPPVLTDVVPMSTTLVSISDDGVFLTMGDTEMVSWTLPLMGPGDEEFRSFSVLVDDDLISGTHIVNWDYAVIGYGNIVTDAVTIGLPVTTTVKEVGLIDSFKVVTPQLVSPGPGNVLTYVIHLVNSSPLTVIGATAYDVLPWAPSTYRRDAVASAGELISDIISISWEGDIDPFSEVLVTASVLVDADFQGALTNTVVISHPDLLAPVERDAVAYVTDEPVLFIQKSASPDPVPRGERLTYHVRVTNLGQQATILLITDALPSNVTYVPDSATAGGELVGEALRWNWPVLEPINQIAVSFQVTVDQGTEVVNALYGVRSAEGVFALGPPVVTTVKGGVIYLPLVLRLRP